MGPSMLVGDASSIRSTSEYSKAGSEHMVKSFEYMAPDAGDRDTLGRMITPHLDAPVIDDLELLAPAYRTGLQELAQEPCQKESKRLPSFVWT